MSLPKIKSGFSLIELLVVITIVTMLMALATVSYTRAQQKGRDGRRKSDLKAIQQALEIYYQANGRYPWRTVGQMECPDGTDLVWGNAFTCAGITYMPKLPKEPLANNDQYCYWVSTNQQLYSITVNLENDIDPERATVNCEGITRYDWTVSQP